MIVTTNLRYADRPQRFGDERLTAALLDQLTPQAHILEFTGESYGFRQWMHCETHADEHDCWAVDGVDNSERRRVAHPAHRRDGDASPCFGDKNMKTSWRPSRSP